MTPGPGTHHGELPARGHLLALDGVRGLAILMVVCSHAFESNYNSQGLAIRFIGLVFYYGYLGVDLFFVLSGFLITGILYDSLRDSGSFSKFYARRALRIFPLYYGVLAVCLLLTRPLHLHWGHMGWLLVFYLQNLDPTGIRTLSPGAHIALYHFWTLAVEEQFYLIWPAIVFLVRRKRPLFWTMIIASAGALALRLLLLRLGVQGLWINVTMFCRSDSLLLGGALAILYRSLRWPSVLRWAPWIFLGAAAVTLASMAIIAPYAAGLGRTASVWSAGPHYTVLALGFAALLAWSLKPQSVCSSVFQARWLRFLGKYSYGIYVLHVFVLQIITPRMRTIVEQITHSKGVAVVVSGLVAIALSIVAAYASYHLYESPFLKLKHRFDYARASLNQGQPDDAITAS